MRRHFARESGIFAPRSVAGLSILLAGVLLGMFSVVASPSHFAPRAPATVSGAVSPVPTWAIATSPNLTDQNFTAVTCVSASDCWAVGSYSDSNFIQNTLVEHWNGTTWSIVPSPNAGSGQGNALNGVTCTSTSNCWAVGVYQGASAQQTLIEQWNGSSWQIVSSLNSSTTLTNYLNAVTCSSATDCWEIGRASCRERV